MWQVPLLMNKHISGGWKYINAKTGEFFHDMRDFRKSVKKILAGANKKGCVMLPFATQYCILSHPPPSSFKGIIYHEVCSSTQRAVHFREWNKLTPQTTDHTLGGAGLSQTSRGPMITWAYDAVPPLQALLTPGVGHRALWPVNHTFENNRTSRGLGVLKWRPQS